MPRFPGLSDSDLVRALERLGFQKVRQVPADRGRTESQGFIEREGKRQLLRVLSEGLLVVLVINVVATSRFEKYGVAL